MEARGICRIPDALRDILEFTLAQMCLRPTTQNDQQLDAAEIDCLYGLEAGCGADGPCAGFELRAQLRHGGSNPLMARCSHWVG